MIDFAGDQFRAGDEHVVLELRVDDQGPVARVADEMPGLAVAHLPQLHPGGQGVRVEFQGITVTRRRRGWPALGMTQPRETGDQQGEARESGESGDW